VLGGAAPGGAAEPADLVLDAVLLRRVAGVADVAGASASVLVGRRRDLLGGRERMPERLVGLASAVSRETSPNASRSSRATSERSAPCMRLSARCSRIASSRSLTATA